VKDVASVDDGIEFLINTELSCGSECAKRVNFFLRFWVFLSADVSISDDENLRTLSDRT
jgi:hypothetical protein